jgi:pimeloyl-ACP methyl ester carboxylesterase
MNPRCRTGAAAVETAFHVGSLHVRPVLDDVNVAVTGVGPHTLVLLHGFSDNLLTWRRVVPALACGHRVVAIDLPGHGATARTWRAPLLHGYADLVAEVLDTLGVAGAVSLMGNSMGAAVSTVFAERYTERVDAVALIGMPGVRRVPIAWQAAASRPASVAMRTVLRPVPIAHLQRGFGWLYARTASPHLSVIDPYALTAYTGCYVDRDRLFGLAEIARAMLGELRSAHLERILARLDVPVLQIWGRRDRLVPARHVKRGDASIVLSAGGHCPQLDAPDLLLEAVVPFFDASAAADASPRPVVPAVGQQGRPVGSRVVDAC